MNNTFNQDTKLGDFMDWAFDNLDKNQGYSVGYDQNDFLVIVEGGDVFVRDMPMTIQAGPYPMELGYT